MAIRRRLMCVCSLIICVLVVVSDAEGNVKCQEKSFGGVERLRVMECKATGSVFGMDMSEEGENPKSLMHFTTFGGYKCTVKSTLAACNYSGDATLLYVAGQVIIADLKEQETRRYRCTVNFVEGASTKPETCYANATLPLGAATTSPSTTVKGIGLVDEVSTSVPSPSTQAAVLFPPSVVVVILVVLIILAVTTFTLTFILCRQRQESRKESLQVADLETADYLEPVPDPASRNAGRAQETPASSQNAALESDDYEDAEAVSVFAAPEQGRGDYYSRLQMSNVGVRSDYSELGGQHDTA